VWERKPREQNRSWQESEKRRVTRAMRETVGQRLEKMYSGVLREPLPPNIADLLRRLVKRGR
jgi:hypothetical protein